MHFTIFQMPISIWHKDHIIFTADTPVRLENYNAVWQDTLPDNEHRDEMRVLEIIFERFNLNHPMNYARRSISAGDIVKLNDNYYLCCTIGWTKIE